MSKWIEFVKAFAEKNNLSYKEAMSSEKCKKEYSKNKMKGGYLPNNLKYVKTILMGRNDLPPKVRNILKKLGGEIIINYKLKRAPVSSFLRSALSAVSFGEFNKRFEASEYDDLFHLYLEITTQNNNTLNIEKNEVINFEMSPEVRPKEEVKNIENFPVGITINELMNKTKEYMGQSNFINYSANNNNCQDFILSVLDANNIGDESDKEFVKQDTAFLFENLPYLRKISNTITTLGARANVITTGAGSVYKKPKIKKPI
jgi:hypothetical protein